MLVLPQVLTHSQAVACLAAQWPLLRSQAGDAAVQVDASALQQFDSSALAVLLEFRREALALGRRFVVLGLPARLAELAALYGIDGLLAVA
jgi:phospholipid transport system transporter-binding protein